MPGGARTTGAHPGTRAVSRPLRHRRLLPQPGSDGKLRDGDWLNTGDLGYLAADELYLTGREKDIVILGGHNIHPRELEEAASQVGGVRRGGVAVFPATDPRTGSARLVVLAETLEREASARNRIMADIAHLAVDLIGLPADDIVLAPPRRVLKTSSGTIRRADDQAWRLLAWTVFAILVPLAWEPVTLIGTRALLPGDSLRPHRSTLQVLIGEPLTPRGKDWQAALQLRDAARHWILARLSEPESTSAP